MLASNDVLISFLVFGEYGHMFSVLHVSTNEKTLLNSRAQNDNQHSYDSLVKIRIRGTMNSSLVVASAVK